METCAECSRFKKPSWETNGFGTCFLNSDRKEQKLLPMFKIIGDADIKGFGPHESFGCNQFERRS